MINYDSILSAFDGKPTLLQWLKMVKKALDESVLKDVTIAKDGDNIAFTFNFEDGTSITTPKVALPKGDKGDTGATGPKGDKGNDGVSITGINTVGSEVVGDETLTTLRANYSNDTTDDFVVTAKNGKNATGSGSTYIHLVKMTSGTLYIHFYFYSTKRNLTKEDAFALIPENGKIPVYISDGNKSGVVPANKESNNSIRVQGLVYDTASSTTELYAKSAAISTYTDILIGENL